MKLILSGMLYNIFKCDFVVNKYKYVTIYKYFINKFKKSLIINRDINKYYQRENTFLETFGPRKSIQNSISTFDIFVKLLSISPLYESIIKVSNLQVFFR